MKPFRWFSCGARMLCLGRSRWRPGAVREGQGCGRGWQGLLVLALATLAACSAPNPLAETQPGEHGRVVRVIDGDALVLDTRQSVRLIGIEAPARP
ncbi:MAG: hypothetical protein V7741_15080 [Hyphomonas sp.]